MKISQIRIYHLRAPLKTPFGFSQWTFHSRETTLVSLHTDSGHVGWGEAYGPPLPILATLQQISGPAILGRDPRDVESTWAYLYARTIDYGQKGPHVAALSAIDIACWDLKSRIADQPLYRHLGAAHTESIPCYATGLYFRNTGNLETELCEEAAQYADEGFTAVKMKVGLGIDTDTRLVRSVRRTLGEGVRLMIDANHCYTTVEAIELGRRLDDCHLGWFEEPTSPLDIAGYREIRSRLNVPIAGGECEQTRFGFAPWLEGRALDYLQPDLCQCGGITEGLKIAAIAATHGIHLTPHVWGTAIGQAAALHFYAARPRNPFTLTPEQKLIENDRTENPLRTAIVREPVVLKDGSWYLPQTPGLGIEVAVDSLEPFAVSSVEVS